MNRSTLIMGLTVGSAMAILGLWVWITHPADPGPLVYVDTPSELDGYVALGRPGISTSENYIGHRIRIVGGSVTNISNETLRSVRMRLRFTDATGNAVHVSEEEALSAALEPGGERRYTFRFENLPAEWDYRVPEVAVTRIGY